jgi:hypothetical protein
MACVQVDFIQALLPEFPKKSNSCIIYRQNQVQFVPSHGHNQRPLVPKKVPIKR